MFRHKKIDMRLIGRCALFLISIFFLQVSWAAHQQVRWGPPYTLYSIGENYHGFSSSQDAIELAAEELSLIVYFDRCKFVVDESDPYARNGLVASTHFDAWPGKTCDEAGDDAIDATQVGATPYYGDSIGKNLGDPCCNAVGNPINAGIGNKYQKEIDFRASDELQLVRYYNSSELIMSAHFGHAWRHNYDKHLDYLAGYRPDGSFAESATAIRQDGKIIDFFHHNGEWDTGDRNRDRLADIRSDDGKILGWKYFDANKYSKEYYDASGYLKSISYRDGGKVTLEYMPSKFGNAQLLAAVKDSHGRKITFAYGYLDQIASIKLPDGRFIKYTYNDSCDYSRGNLSTITYPDGATRKYEYVKDTKCHYSYGDAYLTGIIDESGSKFATFSYEDEYGAPSWQYGSSGSRRAILSMHGLDAEKHEFAYLGNGSVRVTYPEGVSAVLNFGNYKGNVQLSSVSELCNPACKQEAQFRSYDERGYPTSLVDFKGNVSAREFDDQGLLTKQIDAQGTSAERAIVFTWDKNLRMPLSRVVRDGNDRIVESTAWAYNDRGQVLARCKIDSSIEAAIGFSCSNAGSAPFGVRRWTYTYCAVADATRCPIVGLLLTASGPRTDVTQTTKYSYYMTSSTTECGVPGAACYQPGDLQTITNAKGHVITIASYDANGRITRFIDANGVNMDMTYTSRGLLASRSVNGQTTIFTYTPYGAVQSVTDADGVITTYSYDTAHRLVKIADALGNYIQYTLDAAGNKTAEQVYDANGALHKSLTRSLNSLGQMVKIVDGLNTVTFDAKASDSYDANGNLVQSADGLGIQRKLGYDSLNRLVQTLDNYKGTDVATVNSEGKYSFDALDRINGIGDPDGLNTVYTYDGLGNLTQRSSPDSGSTKNTYDPAGNLVQSIDARGIRHTYTYDALNRLTSGSTGDLIEAVTYAYDEANTATECSASYPAGRLTRVIENTITTTYCYDARGNVITKLQSFSTYSVGGSCAPGMICHQNMEIEGRKITNYSTYYTYTDAGWLKGLIYPSGTQVTYGRDANGRIQSVTVTPYNGVASTLIKGIVYLPFGPLANYVMGNGETVTLRYDTNYRLNDISTTSFMASYQRDAMGRIINRDNDVGLAESYQYDPLGRLAAIKDASGGIRESYTYSKAGDRLSKTGNGQATGKYSYQHGTHWLTAIGDAARTYDATGNAISSSVGGENWGYGYDGRNRMKTVQRNGNTVATYIYNAFGERVAKTVMQPQAVNERFFYNEASQLIAELGTANRDYIWLDNLPVGVVENTEANGIINYVVADDLGTPRAIQDASSNTIWSWQIALNSFGELPATSSNGYVYNLRFPGQYFDVETELYFNNQRDYEPATGRYRQADPIGFSGGQWSLYGYANNNPLRYVDPTGMDAILMINPNAVNLGIGYGGHAAVAIGNDSTGWNFYSEGGHDANGNQITTTMQFPNLDALEIALSADYPLQEGEHTQPLQDILMKTWAKDHLKDPFHGATNNCADFAMNVLREGGLNPTANRIGPTIPNDTSISDGPNDPNRFDPLDGKHGPYPPGFGRPPSPTNSSQWTSGNPHTY